MRNRSAFTLIELLIVVAIIAILAAIAVPNFMEGSVRSKVARVKTDFRTLAAALELYHVDNQAYPEPLPQDVGEGGGWLMKRLTTPRAYISSLPDDQFLPPQVEEIWGVRRTYRYTSYPFAQNDDEPINDPADVKPARATVWCLASNGPDLAINTWGFYVGYEDGLFFGGGPKKEDGSYLLPDWELYDPTNGTKSDGDIVRASDRVFE